MGCKTNLNYVCTVVLLFVVFTTSASEKVCPDTLSVDITNERKLEDGSVYFDGLLFPPQVQYNKDDTLRACPCALKKCVRRCCPRGQVYEGKTCRLPRQASYNIDFPLIPEGILDKPIRSLEENFYVLYDNECSTELRYSLFAEGPKKVKSENYTIRNDGVLLLHQLRDNVPVKLLYKPENYCIAWSENFNVTKFLVCGTSEEVQDQELTRFKRWTESAGLWMSIIFLTLTFVVYSMFRSLRNLYGKSLMAYVATLAIAYSALNFIKIGEIQNQVFDDIGCRVMVTCGLDYFTIGCVDSHLCPKKSREIFSESGNDFSEIKKKFHHDDENFLTISYTLQSD
uniref:Methuselah N-terminal domain-containing protein n=1 Tax=Trichogramma kaykai TaxID=54128 RepID=A0ABD2WYV1_9HYME